MRGNPGPCDNSEVNSGRCIGDLTPFSRILGGRCPRPPQFYYETSLHVTFKNVKSVPHTEVSLRLSLLPVPCEPLYLYTLS